MKTSSKLALSVKLYPWYAGLSLDLIFYVAFNTIWLVDVKGFDAAQVTFIATISGISAILLQTPILYAAKRLGTTKSVRLSALFLLLCSIMITISNSYFGFVIAQICYVVSNLLGAMGNILLKNNLDRLHEGHRFSELASKSCVIYSAATMLAALLIGALFSCWQYLPMILGIITCSITLALSFYIEDVTERTQKSKVVKTCRLDIKPKLAFPRPTQAFFGLLVFYALVYGLIATSQTDGKLFIQSQLSTQLSVDEVTTVFGIVIFTSRIARLICDLIYPKVYRRLHSCIVVLFPTLVLIGIALILLGFGLDIDFYLKIVLMTFGFSIFPSLRDPFRIYCQNLCLQKLSKTYQKDALIYLNTARQCGELIISGIASAILLHAPLEYVYINLSIFAILAIVYSLRVKQIFRRV